MLEEVLDLLEGDVGEIGVIAHALVAPRQLDGRDCDHLLVAAAVILHDENADRPAVDHRTRHDRARIAHEHVDRIAVGGERVRNEAVVTGVAHGRVEKAIDEQRARSLVHLVLDRLAADRHFDDDVDVLWRVFACRHGIEAH